MILLPIRYFLRSRRQEPLECLLIMSNKEPIPVLLEGTCLLVFMQEESFSILRILGTLRQVESLTFSVAYFLSTPAHPQFMVGDANV